MSFSNWSDEGYGVREDSLRKISTEALVKKFKELHPDKCKDAADDRIEDIAGEFYSDYGIVSINGVVGEMVSKKLFKHTFENRIASFILMAMNENGDEIIGLYQCYPWQIPDTASYEGEYRSLNKDRVKKAFVEVFKELGVELDPDEVDEQSMEDWG
jgi:hypothetical protein